MSERLLQANVPKELEPAQDQHHQPNELQRIIEAGRDRAEKIHGWARTDAAVFLGSMAVGVFEAAAPDFASASSSSNGPNVTTTANITSETIKMSGSVNNGSQFNTSNANITFLSFVQAKGLRENQILKDKHGRDRCFSGNGKHGYNSGLTINSPTHPTNINQVDWYADNAPGTVCAVPKSVSITGFARKLCGNLFMFKKPPAKETVHNEVVLVRSWLNAKIKISANAKAHAASTCIAEAPGAFSEGHGEGDGSGGASEVLSLKDYVKSRGQGKAIARIFARAKGRAEARADAKASSRCKVVSSSSSTTTTTTTTTTPNSPPQQQGPNIVVLQKVPGFEGPFVNGQDQICADANSNPTGDGVTVTFRAKYGQTSPAFSDGKPNEFCTTFTAANIVVSDEDVTATATDNINGLVATDDTGPFPVMQDSFLKLT